MANQQWKDVEGFEGLYMVSNCGKIFSVRNNCIIKTTYNNSGYEYVSLYFEGKQKTFLVHRLVARAFIPNNNNYPCVNHKDEDKTNNYVFVNEDGSVDYEKSNLEWCTYSYNYHYGSTPIRARLNHLNIKSMSKPVICVKNGIKIKEYPSIREAERQTGIKNQNIVLCCQGKIKKSGGFIWKYKQF